jgi:hypothetical protein
MLKRVHIITPLGRPNFFNELRAMLFAQGVCSWILLGREGKETLPPADGFVVPTFIDVPEGIHPGMALVNRFVQQQTFVPGDYYAFHPDDDWYPRGLVTDIALCDAPLVVVSMPRGHNPVNKYGCSKLVAAPENFKLCHFGFEQVFARGDVMNELRQTVKLEEYNELMMLRAGEKHPPLFRPDLEVLFNWLEPGLWNK